jgi:peptidoglycan/LPS O-acetylase OafA/YrhL
MDNNGLSLKILSRGRVNNFDFLRFIAAVFVIFSHSFPLTYGTNKKEIFYILTHGQLSFGNLAVKIFFIISGFLIAQSWDNTKNILKFMKARILRIFPGIIVVVLLSTFVLGAVFTTYPLKEYFNTPATYRYLSSITLYKLHYNLPGVFGDNIYKNAVNGSLWTLMYEFNCYILIGLLGVFKILKKQIILPLFILTFILNVINLKNNSLIINSIPLLTCFLAGTLFYCYKDKITLKASYFLLCLILFLISTQFPHFDSVSTLLLPYIILYLAFTPAIKLNKFASKGDLSYGIYIYAFPIQQIIVHLFDGNLHWYTDFVIALPFVLICSFISWHLVEKPCMKLKNIEMNQLYHSMKKQLQN